MEDFLKSLELDSMTKEKVNFLNPLTMAYMGDIIYEVYVRNYILHKYGGSVNELHKISTKFVRARAQANIVHSLESELTEEEWSIVKRGRNQKSGSIPKNASLVDYKYATGFEALIGYLYLLKRNERLEEIIIKAIEIVEASKE